MKSYIRFLLLTIVLLTGGIRRLNAQGGSGATACTCECLRPFFDYLIKSNRLFIQPSDGILVSDLLEEARNSGYSVSFTQCQILSRNVNGSFYAKTQEPNATVYRAVIGDCTVSINSTTGLAVTFAGLLSDACGTDGTVTYHTSGTGAIKARLKVDSCLNCTDDDVVRSCYSAVTESSVNAYLYGLAGNWRPSRSYAYYDDRKETDPSPSANISMRTAGTISNFRTFWKFSGGSLQAMQDNSPDTTKWVWNSELTLVNRKGLELENRDPLGRYNAGLYGYDDALPVAVVQNARYREIAFEGFEDYDFGGNPCDAACSVPRSFDFSFYKNQLDITQQHTGMYSLRVDSSAGITASIKDIEGEGFGMTFNRADVSCGIITPGLASIKTDSGALLPSFSPIAGKTIVVSAWVKEQQDCKGNTYTGNYMALVIKQPGDSNTVVAHPKGAIIEGWQRYEEVIAIPDDAVSLSLLMKATAGHAVFFDDIRIHPYNANMKSFVYGPSDLRLMAELDENNYATFYEYDDDGTLIRLKKETERGIKTITETRSALLKENIDQ
ncbi:hypothetical protein [Chitinophaga sp. S165]|uniref:hypothetical protein n=1 Tax=Chitinophaga sp. S165 TaxID=2135462 RepID=UPI000D712796|nr:hypothetical protein [Chitinophaga sp. S165]PWV55750.1 hypothetical protein C7475_101257 [Chitinophaga sp. S165]